MRVTSVLERPRKITLVDDVVTKGATLLAAASLLAQAFPEAEIQAFALIRTMGLVPEVERIVDPVVGRIFRTPSGGADRRP
jgi:adenine/guanine phosphoribosyltransferase-like PRPP-binding protein